jgi:hypothetical protein
MVWSIFQQLLNSFLCCKMECSLRWINVQESLLCRQQFAGSSSVHLVLVLLCFCASLWLKLTLLHYLVALSSDEAYNKSYTAKSISTCWESCGGHGYAVVNHFGALRNDHDIFRIFEGDNTDLLQQVLDFVSLQQNMQKHIVEFWMIMVHEASKVKTVLPPALTQLQRLPNVSCALQSTFVI